MTNYEVAYLSTERDKTGAQIGFNYVPEMTLRKLVNSLPIYTYSVLYKNGVAVETYHSPQCAVITGYNLIDYESDPMLWLKMVYPEDKDDVLDFFGQLRKHKSVYNCKGGAVREDFWGSAIEHRLIHKDGSIKWVLNHGTPTFDEDGRLARLDGMVMDISDQKWSQEELVRQLDREIRVAAEMEAVKNNAEDALTMNEKFISLATHDIRSPLTSIITMAKLLDKRERPIPDSDREALVGRIGSVARDMLEMMDELLGVTRLRSGKIQPCLRFFNAFSASLQIMETLGAYAESKRVRLVNLIPPNTRVYADQRLFSEILRNIVSNAIKFSGNENFFPAGRKFTVETGVIRGNGLISIYVKDDGPGVKPELIPDLFNYNIHTSTTGTGGEKGTGFGLPFCYEAIKAHNGGISLQSKTGEGATFCISFKDKKPSVLIADDDAGRRQSVAEYLKPFDLDITHVCDNAGVLEVLGQKETHLVITAAKSPGIDGVELLSKIRAAQKFKTLPLILYLPDKDETTVNNLLQFDHLDVIALPTSPDGICPIVRRHVG